MATTFTFTIGYDDRPYRVVYEDGVLRGDHFMKGKNDWKPSFHFTTDTFIVYNNGGGQVNMWEDKRDYELGYIFHTKMGPVQEFLKLLATTYPETKWAMKKFAETQTSLTALVRYMQYRDVPETESLITLTHRYTETWTSWDNRPEEEVLSLLGKSWPKMKASDRRTVINNTRKAFADPQNARHLIRFAGLKAIIHYYDEKPTSTVVYGYGPLAVTKADQNWLEKHPETWNERVERIGEATRLYHDWLQMQVREEGVTDVTDNYFRHRRDWLKRHDRIVRRENWRRRLNGLRIFLGLPELDYPDKKKVARFQKRYAKWIDRTLEHNGYKAYVSNDIKAWENRATKLRQCIVSCSYYAHEDCVLVFIDKDDEPIATGEIRLPSNTLGQFYGDEHDRALMRPTAEVREVMDLYMQTYKF